MSGNGLRVIFKYETPSEFRLNSADKLFSSADKIYSSAELNRNIIGFYESAFYAGNAYYENLQGLKADMQCKNVTRLSDLAHDPDVFLRPESEAVPFTVDEITTAAAAYARQSKEDKQLGRIQTYYDTLIAPQLAQDGIRFQSGSHNEYVMRVGYRLAEKRFSKKVALRWAVALFGSDYPDTEQVITSCFANASPSSHGETRGGGSGGKRSDSKFASVDEIKAFLDGHVKLRLNEITSRVEYLSAEFNRNINGENDTGEAPTKVRLCSADDIKSNDWQSINDRTVNSLWSKMSEVARVNKQDLYSIIESDYVPLYHPFREYLRSLPQISQIITDDILPTKVRLSSADNIRTADRTDYIPQIRNYKIVGSGMQPSSLLSGKMPQEE